MHCLGIDLNDTNGTIELLVRIENGSQTLFHTELTDYCNVHVTLSLKF